MTREKIIELAIRCNILSEVDLLESNPWRQDTIRELTEFYLAARNEALEEAAVQLDGNHAHTFGRHCAAHIRKLKK